MGCATGVRLEKAADEHGSHCAVIASPTKPAAKHYSQLLDKLCVIGYIVYDVQACDGGGEVL